MAKDFEDLYTEGLAWLDEDTDSPVFTLLKAALNEANASRVADAKWPFMLSAITTLTLVPGTRTYTLPADFMKPHWFYNQTASTPIRELGSARQSEEISLVAEGLSNEWPVWTGPRYVQEGNSIRLLWTPTTADTILYQYFKQPTEMVAAADLPDIPAPYSNVLLYDALLLVKPYTTEGDLIKLWEKQQQKWETNLIQHYLVERPLGAIPEYVHMEEWED